MGLMKLLRQSVPSTVLWTMLAHLCLFVFIFGYGYMHEGSDDGFYADIVQTFMMVARYTLFPVFGFILEREMKKTSKRYEAMVKKASARSEQGGQVASDDRSEQLVARAAAPENRPPRASDPTFITPEEDEVEEAPMHQDAPDVREASAMSFEPEELEDSHVRLVQMMESRFEEQANRTAEQLPLFP